MRTVSVRPRCLVALGFVFTAAAFVPAATSAPRSDAGKEVRVEFPAGQSCWKYRGDASAFKGAFLAGQRLIITSTGEAHFGDAHGQWITTQSREVSVFPERSSGEIAADQSGERVIPVTGRYSITVWPHAIQGYPGVMIVCKR